MAGAMASGTVRLFLGGDVMTGRGIDQILPHPSDPALHEDYVRSALDYLDLAEQRNGAVPRNAALTYVWGALLDEFAVRRPDRRIVNLETAVTTSDEAAPKGINYRMHPKNVGVLGAAGLDACVVANNHVLDWGPAGLIETLDTLDAARIGHAGAGRDAAEAGAPLVLSTAARARVLVVAFGCASSGIPPGWRAGMARPGVNLLPEHPGAAVAAVRTALGAVRRAGDIVVVSVHWGGNWGHDIPLRQRDIAHALVGEADTDIVFGHSSHHPKAVEVHRGRLIIYGAGDLLNDYEGIAGRQDFPSDLALGLFADVEPATGRLLQLDMVPFRIARFRLSRPSPAEIARLAATMDRECGRFGSNVQVLDRGTLRLTVDRGPAARP